MPAVDFQLRDAIGHYDGNTGDLEHFDVVMIVADRQNFFAPESAAFRPFGKRTAFGAVGWKDINHGEVTRFIERDGEAIARGEIGAAKDFLNGTHFRNSAGEHDLNGIFGDGIFKRGNDADVREISFVISITDGVVFAERFKHDLICYWPIKNDCCAFAPGPSGLQNAASNTSREQMAKMRCAVRGADQGAVVDDHGKRTIQLLRDGHGEIVAASGDESDFNAAAGGFGDGGPVGVGKLPSAVEQCAVNIESDEANSHGLYFTVNGREIRLSAGVVSVRVSQQIPKSMLTGKNPWFTGFSALKN